MARIEHTYVGLEIVLICHTYDYVHISDRILMAISEPEVSYYLCI